MARIAWPKSLEVCRPMRPLRFRWTMRREVISPFPSVKRHWNFAAEDCARSRCNNYGKAIQKTGAAGPWQDVLGWAATCVWPALYRPEMGTAQRRNCSYLPSCIDRLGIASDRLAARDDCSQQYIFPLFGICLAGLSIC